MKARDLLRTVEDFARRQFEPPEQIIRELPDEQFRLAVYASAELFSTLKKEAVRRGIWDELKVKKPALRCKFCGATSPTTSCDATGFSCVMEEK